MCNKAEGSKCQLALFIYFCSSLNLWVNTHLINPQHTTLIPHKTVRSIVIFVFTSPSVSTICECYAGCRCEFRGTTCTALIWINMLVYVIWLEVLPFASRFVVLSGDTLAALQPRRVNSIIGVQYQLTSVPLAQQHSVKHPYSCIVG